eukprot:COSAG01_NODE_6909_length_3443_cov_13.005981_4_plen_62_part_00
MWCVFFDKTFEITQQAGCMSEGLTQWLGFGCARRFLSDLAFGRRGLFRLEFTHVAPVLFKN